MQYKHYKTGKFITKQEAIRTDRVPLVLFIIVCAISFTCYGAIELQAKVQEWSMGQIELQDMALEHMRADNELIDITIIPVDSTVERTAMDATLWCGETKRQLVRDLLETDTREQGENVIEKMFDDQTQYSRDTMYIEELDINSLVK